MAVGVKQGRRDWHVVSTLSAIIIIYNSMLQKYLWVWVRIQRRKWPVGLVQGDQRKCQRCGTPAVHFLGGISRGPF